MNRRMPLVPSALLVVLIAGAVAAGCSREPAPPLSVRQPAQDAAPSTGGAPSSEAPQAPISAMKPDDKRSLIATSFPLEVPVPVGELTRAKAQGDDAWDYTILVTATPQALLDWYRTVYTAAQWTRDRRGRLRRGGQPRTVHRVP